MSKDLQLIGNEILSLDSVMSTMDIAWEHYELGKEHGLVILAKRQTQGRGRFSRRWVTGYDETLSMSVLLNPPLDLLPFIPIAANLAISDTLNDLANVECLYKWPNDVLVSTRKISGVLLESRVSTDGVCAAVIGIGANINLDVSAYSELSDSATSLYALTNQIVDMRMVEKRVIQNLQNRYAEASSNPAYTLAKWSASLATLGKEIVVHQRSGAISGIAEGIDNRGRLILRLPSGKAAILEEGDVTLSA